MLGTKHLDIQNEIQDNNNSIENIPHLLVQNTTFGNVAITNNISNIAIGNRVDFIRDTQEYKLYENGTLLGSFNIQKLIKYIISPIESEIHISSEYELITRYLVTLEKKDNNYIKFNIVNSPPITTNYNMMINLSRALVEFEESHITNLIPNKDTKLIFLVQRFIMNILEYTIKMIAIIIDTQNIPYESKIKLFYHSVILHSYSTRYITYKINEQKDIFASLDLSLTNINSVQSAIENKQVKLDTLICQQNTLLTTAIDKCFKHQSKNTTKESVGNIAHSIKDLTEKIQKMSELAESDQHEGGGLNNKKILMQKTITDSDDNNFNENYNDTENSPPVNIQKIESSNCSALLNM